MKKILCLILALLMLLPLAVSCSKDEEEGDGESTVATEEGEETVNMPYKDFGGKEFKLLVSESDYGLVTFSSENYGESQLDKAVYDRNTAVETRLNVKIVSEEVEYHENTERTDVLCSSGTFEYDAFVQNMTEAVPLTLKGYYADTTMFGSNTIDMSQPWWDSTAASGLRLNGKTYALIGDAVLHYFESAYIMVYNKDYANDLGISNLAETAISGDWTLEKLNQYAKLGYNDKNNNSAKDSEDTFGLVCGGGQFVDASLLCSGETILDYDNDNYPSFSSFSARTLEIFDYVKDNLVNCNETFMASRDNAYLAEGDSTWHDVFIKKRALFYAEPVGSLQKLRDVSFEFTILPFPKYDRNDGYITLMLKYAEGLFVPISTPNCDDTGIILENLMYESYKTVRPVYFETVASVQRVRNNDSYRIMTEIVWESPRVVSLLQIYDFGSMETQIVEYALSNQSISSLSRSLSKTMNKYIEKSIGAKQK